MTNVPFQLSDLPDSDGVYEALAHERRRRVLEILVEADRPLSLSDVARELHRRDAEDGAVDPVDDRAREIHVELYHAHVPKLVDAGLVEHDRDAGTVAIAADAPL